jgi:hypothetical protein
MVKWEEYAIKQSRVILRFYPTFYMKMGFSNIMMNLSVDTTSPNRDSNPESPDDKAAYIAKLLICSLTLHEVY